MAMADRRPSPTRAMIPARATRRAGREASGTVVLSTKRRVALTDRILGDSERSDVDALTLGLISHTRNTSPTKLFGIERNPGAEHEDGVSYTGVFPQVICARAKPHGLHHETVTM